MSGITENVYLVDEIQDYSLRLRIDGKMTPVSSRDLSVTITGIDKPAGIDTGVLHFDPTAPEGEWVEDEGLGVRYMRSVSV